MFFFWELKVLMFLWSHSIQHCVMLLRDFIMTFCSALSNFAQNLSWICQICLELSWIKQKHWNPVLSLVPLTDIFFKNCQITFSVWQLIHWFHSKCVRIRSISDRKQSRFSISNWSVCKRTQGRPWNNTNLHYTEQRLWHSAALLNYKLYFTVWDSESRDSNVIQNSRKREKCDWFLYEFVFESLLIIINNRRVSPKS